MLKITGFSNNPCFLTGDKGADVVEVKFTDKSFTGSLSWSALLGVLKRKAADAQTEKGKIKHEAVQKSQIPVPKTEA